MPWTVIFVSQKLQITQRKEFSTKREAHVLLRGHTRIYRSGRTYYIHGVGK